MHGSLQAQGVPCPQTTRRDIQCQQLRPEFAPVVAAQQQFCTILARVAGSGAEHLLVQPLQLQQAMAKAGQFMQSFSTELFENGDRFRTLQGQQHAVLLFILNTQAARLQLLFHPGRVACSAGGVDHDQEGSVACWCLPLVVNDQIVTDAAVVVEQHRVTGLPGADPVQVRWHEGLKRILGIAAFNAEHAHMGDVEHPHGFADGFVFGDQA